MTEYHMTGPVVSKTDPEIMQAEIRKLTTRITLLRNYLEAQGDCKRAAKHWNDALKVAEKLRRMVYRFTDTHLPPLEV